jgi:hypothetical protein
VPQRQDGRKMAGKHRRNQLCNHCGKAEGDTGSDGERLSLLIDLEDYEDEERIFQGRRSPENPLPLYLVWCRECACQMVHAGDPIASFRELGFPDNSPDGPYARYLARHGRGLFPCRRDGD